MADPDRRIPVTVLTGFLGAGKTTVLNHVLRHPGAARTAVLINELGEVGVDHHLVEQVDETLVVLDGGCVCCSVQGDLVAALKRLFMQAFRKEIPPIDRVLLETTGLADPAPVVHTLMEEPFIADRYRCDGVVTAVDVTHAAGQLKAHREALRQAAMADRLLLTKCDLAAPDDIAALQATLAALNPGARQIPVTHGEVAIDDIFGGGLYTATGKLPEVVAWLGEAQVRAAAAAAPVWRKPGKKAPAGPVAHHADGVESYVLRFDAPLPWWEFSDGLNLILQAYSNRILRIKGVLNVRGDPLPRVIQCVQHSIYPAVSLPAWPDTPPFDDHCSRLVFIVRDLPSDAVVRTLSEFTGLPVTVL
ncbi:CobW family GTP-binding protein [Denitromonas sp.]|uniref:CobW family GTP-binding protein n=1 Tax=Denitromonas sp. TaxID=2734609 RepID=UPI003A85CF88